MPDVLDFDDIGARIMKRLVDNDVPHRTQLTAAAQRAGIALKRLQRRAVAMTEDGAVGQSVADVPPRAVIIVLANAEHALILAVNAAVRDWQNQAEQLAELNRERYEVADDPEGWLGTLACLVERFPVETTILAPDVALDVFGMLLAVLPDQTRQILLTDATEIIDTDVCPAAFALFGAGGLDGGAACVWPLLLPLGRYGGMVAKTEPVSGHA